MVDNVMTGKPVRVHVVVDYVPDPDDARIDQVVLRGVFLDERDIPRESARARKPNKQPLVPGIYGDPAAVPPPDRPVTRAVSHVLLDTATELPIFLLQDDRDG